MSRLIRSPRSKRDVREVIAFTLERWGESQARVYGQLIKAALDAVAADPSRGRSLKGRPDILAFPIRRGGQPARHALFYRIQADGTVVVLRLLHDAMDVAQHLP